MPTVFARQTTTVFSIIIACLLILCIGLLVAVLKGQIYHENSIAASVSSHRVGVTTEKPTSENNIPTVHQLPNAIQTNGESSTEMVTEDTLPRSSTWENFRLSPHVKPLHYDLLLHPNLKTDNFTGTVKITVNLTELIDHFVMHAFRLNVFNPRVYNVHERTEVQVRQTFLYDPNEFYVIELESVVKPGIYEIELHFSGSLVDKIVGFYKSRYVNSATNETRYLATSKFQPTYARRAFPCFDEPSFKSTFTVSLVHDAEHIALSNMPAEGTVSYLDGDLKITKFEKSVPMVTYLICFIVCDFEYKKTTTKGGKEFRVYATKDNLHSVEYAVDFGSKVLNFFEDYFAIEYSLPKQDMVAIPDFVSGAMEHWGVITFRETNILYDPMKSSPQNKQRVSEVISHEMAHMWFGNLVTMEWWDDLWLNEGFASYIEYKGVDDLHPKWHMLEQFVTDSLQPVMDIDSTISSHPIVQSVSHPDEITEIFDDISYNKGASILRMLEFFTGADTFREGISRFLKKYKYQNARTQDLWEELSNHNQNELNISEIMGTWTQQMGFPFVTVTRDPQNPSTFKAKQQRFVKNREIYTLYQDDKEYIWHVPLSYITSTGESGIIWLRNSSSEIFEIPVSNSDWVKFNINQTGYYIVNYDDEGWQRMIDLLKTDHEVLTPSDRSNLIFDAFLLAEAGHIKYDILLSMLTYLKNESHLVPWETAYASLVYLSRLLEATEVDSLIKRYIKEITEPLYWKLGWEETEDHLDNLLRNTIIGLACHSGNRDCLDTTALLLKNWTTGFEIPTTLRRLVYHYGMKEVGNEEYWNLMWNRYMKEESPQERKTLLYGLSHVRQSTLIHRFLDHAMNESEIRRQDFFSVLTYLAGNPVARRIVWNFLRNKWEALVNRFSLNDRYLGLSVKKICTFFKTEDEYNEMRTFFAKYPDAGAGKRRRQQALENVQNNIKWLKTYQDQMRTLFLVESPSPWLHYKLPPHIIPQHYDLILQPDIENSNFTGSVSINIEITTPSNYILMHARGLNISKTEISNIERNSEESPSLLFNFSNNTYWVIQFSEKLPSGKYKLCFEFSGNFSDLGMFKEKYTDLNNTARSIMATQFEDTYARNVFPCFDEPTFKTTFNISIIHSPEYTALSNTMELESKILENGLTMTRFEKTVPMVTYLVCIVIGDIDFKETYIDSGARLRVYAVSHNVEKTTYALETGKALLNIFEKYFGYPYPLKKIDFIAVPGGRFGMENWGLVLFGDAGMLVDNSSSKADIERVTILIAHELAHMWFGNLVTMKWWDDLWLNEGFATYISYKGVDTLHPSYNYMADFILGPLSIALRKDGSVFSRPIVQTTRTSTDIGQMFDSISYDKGASILRMLETLMGDDFRNGVSAYLKKYAYQNVNTDDLWSELTLASKKELDVKMLMNTWTKQMNYPFINVTRNETDQRYVTISQHRYVLKNESTVWEDDSPYNYVWHVPLTYHTSNNSTLQSLMLNSTNKLTMKLPQSEWIKFNVNFTGYYLVNYDVKDWHHFIDILKTNHTIFNQMDRSNLLHDSFALAKAGHLSYNISLELFSYLRNETEWIPWSIASDILAQLKLIEHAVGSGVAFREFVRNLSKGLYRKLAWKEAKDIPGRILRNTIMEISCKYRNIECLREAKSLFKRWLAGESIDPEYRSLVYFYGIQTIKDESSFKLMLEKYANEKSYDEKIDILKGLANTRNFTHCEWLIRTSENESRVDKDDYLFSLKMMSHNPYCSIFVLDFVLKNWTQLQMRFPTQKRSMAGLVKDIFRTVRAEHVLKQLQSFFKKYPDAVTAKEKVQIVDGIWHRINWILTDGVEIHNWLSEHTYMPWFNLRLPDHTVPSKYDLRVRANVTTGFFDGDVNITVNVVKPTDYIAVHASALDVTAIELQDLSTSENVQIEEEFPVPHNEIWVIRFLKKIPPGGYKLYMKYAGSSTTQLRKGVKTDTYIHNITKEEVPFFYTTFEPTYARRFFPCFDEPSLKASFRLTVVHEPHHVVISNMPDENNFTRTDGLIETQFMESVVMSTYLLCVVISDFTYKETDITHGKKLRFYAPPDRVNGTLHTLEVAPKFLEILEEYYGIPYQLPKLDFVAIPKFSSKGMENWGLIQYTDYLLVTEDMTRDKVFDSDRVVAHELAHMWFGNLVTMCWWNDLWLNEGFSSFAMFIPLRRLYPDVDELTVLYSERGRIKDADYESRPIIHNVSNPGEIRSMFDEISYKKGSAVLKMLANFMKDDFRKGVMNYLKKYAFKNAETNDFWNELSSISNTGINITDVMNTWTRQRGYPYIEIQVDDDYFTASQRLFLLNTEIPEGKEMMKSDYGYTWKIPLTFKNIDTGEEQSYWFNEENATFPLNNSAENCLKFNVNYSGYYIVKYDERGWNCLRNKLLNNHEIFSSVDRINILFDSFLLAEANHIMYDIPLELSKYLRKEKNFGPWMSARINFFSRIQGYLKAGSTNSKLFQNYTCYLIDNIYQDVLSNSTGRSDLDGCVKAYAKMCQHPKYIESRIPELNRWLSGERTVGKEDISGLIPHFENETLWEELWNQYLNTNMSFHRHESLNAFSKFQDKELLQRTMNEALTNKELGQQEILDIFDHLLDNPRISDEVWSFIKSNWTQITNRSGDMHMLLSTRSFTITTEEELEDLTNVAHTFEAEFTDFSYAKKRLKWLRENEETIANWLKWNVLEGNLT